MQIIHGRRSIEIIRLIAPHLDAEKETEVHTAREINSVSGVVEINGARRILNSLPEDSWAIVTSGSSELAGARLDHVALPIPKVLVTSDDVQKGKPAPEPYLVGAKQLGVIAERCVVIEDAPAGIEAGKKAGMMVIGINETHSGEKLLKRGTDLVIHQLNDINIREISTGYRFVLEVEQDT